MLINAFQPLIIGTPLVVTASPQTVVIAYDTKQLCSYRIVNSGTQQVSILFGATPVVTVLNGIQLLPNTVETFTGAPNATIQAIAPATGSTLYVVAGEGL